MSLGSSVCMRATSLLVIVFGLGGGGWARAQQAPVKPEDAGLSTQGLQRVHSLLEEHVARRQVAGAVGLVIRHGQVAYLDAVGLSDVDAAAPMRPDSIFRIASMTKPITSTAVMILAEQGKLDLSDPVSQYLPEFKFSQVAIPRKDASGKPMAGATADERMQVSAYRPITIRDLLRHTSGLSYRFYGRPYFGDLYARAGICDGISACDHSLAENVRRLAGLPLLNQPGTAWEYGLNTDVLGRIVEVVSGKSLDTFFSERILGPLQMRDTHFTLPSDQRSRLAAVYEPGPDKAIVRTGDGPVVKGALIYSPGLPIHPQPGYYSGGAGLVSTAGDYARFLRMMLNHGELDGVRILRPETVAAMTRNQLGSPSLSINAHGDGFGYGFGVVTRPRAADAGPAVGTYNWGGIYNTRFWVDPRNDLIGVLMTQIYPSTHLTLGDAYQKMVYEAILHSPTSAR